MTNPMRTAAVWIALVLALAVLGARPLAQDIGSEGRWSEAAQIPHPRNEMFAGAVDGKLYTFGGFDGETYESTHLEVYDPATDNWTESSPMLDGANHFGITVLDGKIYIAGGFRARQHNGEKDTFLVYDRHRTIGSAYRHCRVCGGRCRWQVSETGFMRLAAGA